MIVAQTRVLMADTDAMGMVYHATYLRWFEVGRAELIRRFAAAAGKDRHFAKRRHGVTPV